MVHDFLLLEMYYGPGHAAQYCEDVVRKHGMASFKKAQDCGHVVLRKVSIGPDRGRMMCWLSDQGREKAERFVL